MRRIGSILLFVAGVAGIGLAQKSAKPLPVFEIHGPTVIAFYPQISQEEMDKGGDAATAMDDFQSYLGPADKRLKAAGIELRVEEARSFRVRIAGKLHTHRGGKIDIGYYFIAPGKAPHVEYGVMTDADLVVAAGKYFGKAIP